MLKNMSAEDSTPNAFDQSSVAASINDPPTMKRKRNLPGNPDPEAEVISLSPKTLMATNRFLCEICGKGFQRDQNLQLHRRGHNLPWKLKQRSSKEPKKRVYVCPEKTCVHHFPSRALGDLTGIKKHFCRKHGEKKWKCEKCSKRYAVQSDWKAHSKTCGTREYKCDCGTLFSRRDSFITHRAFCDALAEETARLNAASNLSTNYHFLDSPSLLGPRSTGQQHFHSIVKPISIDKADEPIADAARRAGLSMWTMGQGMSQLGRNDNYGMNTFNNLQEISGLEQRASVHPPSSLSGVYSQDRQALLPTDYHLSWILGERTPHKNGLEEFKNYTNSSFTNCFSLNNVKEGHNCQNVSVPSLYSSQQQQQNIHQLSTSANMSATALLQKAALIGATSTGPSFLGSLGLKCSSDQSSNLTQLQDGNMSGGLCCSTNNDHIVESITENDMTTFYNHQMQQMHPTKRQNVSYNNEDAVLASSGGQTRDFLGVGKHKICHPSSMSMSGWI